MPIFELTIFGLSRSPTGWIATMDQMLSHTAAIWE